MYLSIPCEVVEWQGASGLSVRTTQSLPLYWYGIGARIPAGFVSDGMSVPRFLWRILGATIDSKTLGPSIVHDWLYQTHILTKSEADGWYYAQLVDNGYGRTKALLVWLGLRLFGWSHW